MQEAVNTLEVDEESVVGHSRDGPLPELLGVGAGEVGHVLDHLGRGGLGDLSLAEGQEAHVDAAELLVNLQWRRKGVEKGARVGGGEGSVDEGQAEGSFTDSRNAHPHQKTTRR